MSKTYEHIENEPVMAGDTVAAYNSSCDIVSLRNHILDLVNNTEKIDKLEECLGILTSDEMPGIYSDEEFKKEVELAEKDGFVSDEEFKRTCFEKWGVAL